MEREEDRDCSVVGIGNKSSNGGGGGGGGGGDSFIDRSRVKILLCDNDSNSTDEVFSLLCKCSYQVITVKSARQVIDALNAEGPEIDIILSEVDLPMAKGLKMLKYIMRDKDWRRIPVIMMSAQDEVPVVVKCLRLGAADYLVKPLRINELLNLWTHMWRRRRMIGLAEKNILNCDFDLVASDPSDANTNSTTLFSDDTDEKCGRIANLDIPTQHEDEVIGTERYKPNAASTAATTSTIEPLPVNLRDCQPDVPGISDQRTGRFSSYPKKSELRIGESSAFFTYVKSNPPKVDNPPQVIVVPSAIDHMNAPTVPSHDKIVVEEGLESHSQPDDLPSSGGSYPDSVSLERSPTPILLDYLQHHHQQQQQQEHHHHHPRTNMYPYYIPGIMSQTPQVFQNNFSQVQMGMLQQQQYNPHHMIPSFPFYPYGTCIQPGQIQGWPSSYGHSSSSNIAVSAAVPEGKVVKIDRREAALIKFRQKRKERCFDKKIRYVNRKRLAERRPRVKGQFVRKKGSNGIGLDLNGQPTSVDIDEYEDDEEEDCAVMDSSPEGL
ncbi:two-component response regulator-like APRR1 [Impatiens glandulifera]|uniref:two-component response regulator-like APRR1 n=1 Tax=Impatiens glandulifera TaxID=253017 RepID=UPI001FB0AF2E|nr:two-component response regulator-like APRR1 [Impatiens glandulifera]